MAKLEGTLAVAGLPPHRGLIVSLCFFRVESATDPAPYGGDPPAASVTDCHEVYKQVDLSAESSRTRYDLSFAIERPAGFYYLQVQAIRPFNVDPYASRLLHDRTVETSRMGGGGGAAVWNVAYGCGGGVASHGAGRVLPAGSHATDRLV